MKVEILYNKDWLDITNDMDTNIAINNQSRIDDTFAIGNFTAILEINENIPPYTPMRINGIYYLCSSVATKHFGEINDKLSYYHNFTILEAAAILSCYILGSKAFSVTGTNKDDIDKIYKVLDLMNYKYNIRLRFQTEPNLFERQELSYGPGTTLYDFLTDILKIYNSRIKVDSFWIEPDQSIESSPIINLSILELDKEIEYGLDLNKITFVEKTQNGDLFNDMLEGEMTNVVDRSNLSYANNLTVRADDIKLTEDNAFIQLPTNVEKISKFGVEGYIGESSMNFYLDYDLCEALGITKTIGGKDFTFEEKENVEYKGVKIARYIYDKLFSDISSWEHFKKITWIYNDTPIDNTSVLLYWAEYDAKFYMKVDIENKLLEKSQWDLLTEREKPKYVWYETSTDKIQGVNTYYKDDFWNNLIGETIYPFLYHLGYVRQTKVVDNIYLDDDFVAGFSKNNETTSERTISKSFTGDYNPLNYSYYIEYTTVSNPMILEKKNDRKNKSYFNISRSYGKQASYIDYDKLNNSIDIIKNSEGLQELRLDLELEDNEELPIASQIIYYEGKKWYISNAIYNIKIGKTEVSLNCVKNYNKVADVIGVETQFNVTKNPLNSIVDRSILIDFGSGAEIDFKELDYIYVKLTFKDYNGIIISNAFKKCSPLINNNIAYLTCEALDFYSIGKQAIKQSGSVYLNKDFPYVDINNEFATLDVEIVKLPLLDVTNNYLLPEYNGEYEMLLKTELIPVFKDAREKLLFTFKVNNIII